MSIIFRIIRNIISTLIFWAIIFTIGVFAWTWYKEKREKRTFIVSFNNVEGLKKGSPIHSRGRKIGKVIQIYPLGNTNDVAVKGLITDKDFPVPHMAIDAKIFSDIESGGGKILEISHIFDQPKVEIGFRKDKVQKKGQNPYILKNVTRIMKNFFQMSKDFAKETYAFLTSKQSVEYKEQLKNSVENTITSLEYGTLKQDVRNSIADLNDEIEDFERHPGKKKDIEQKIRNKARALENTVKAMGSLADVYK